MTAQEEARQHVQDHYAAVERIADAARKFLLTYDEFWDVYKPAIGEDFGALCEAMTDYERLCDRDVPADPILPPYEP